MFSYRSDGTFRLLAAFPNDQLIFKNLLREYFSPSMAKTLKKKAVCFMNFRINLKIENMSRLTSEKQIPRS